jgi:alpha-methylacyl-CoA racemase
MPPSGATRRDWDRTMAALSGVRVIDFSTLLPGPLATLLMAEAGAEVIKVERPGGGDDMRAYAPVLGPGPAAMGVPFALLNRGKCSLALDLKDANGQAQLRPLLEQADVVVEQFRPGVMARLGLGWEHLQSINPRLILCSITGYGQAGPKAQIAAHDLNYLADAGLLSLTGDGQGAPQLPPVLIADIAAGAYPAFMNVLLALRERETTGRGVHLDVSMSDNLFALGFFALAQGWSGHWPGANEGLTTGGSPRYALYRCADGKFLAVAPLEQKFWDNFCAAIGLPEEWRDDARDPAGTRAVVAQCVARRTAAEWQEQMGGRDVCCNLVASVEEACADPHFRARGLFVRELRLGERTLPALPVPLATAVRSSPAAASAPALGEFGPPSTA